MAIWKVSYVIQNSDEIGGIINLEQAPKIGEILEVGDIQVEILEVFELIPPKGDFHYVHATCQERSKKNDVWG